MARSYCDQQKTVSAPLHLLLMSPFTAPVMMGSLQFFKMSSMLWPQTFVLFLLPGMCFLACMFGLLITRVSAQISSQAFPDWPLQEQLPHFSRQPPLLCLNHLWYLTFIVCSIPHPHSPRRIHLLEDKGLLFTAAFSVQNSACTWEPVDNYFLN